MTYDIPCRIDGCTRRAAPRRLICAAHHSAQYFEKDPERRLRWAAYVRARRAQAKKAKTNV